MQTSPEKIYLQSINEPQGGKQVIEKIIEKIDDWFINLNVYGSMLIGLGRRHPKMVLILGFLAFCGICAAHLSLYNSSMSFFGLAAIGSAAVTLFLFFYNNEEKPREGRRHSILETDNDWFAERELKR